MLFFAETRYSKRISWASSVANLTVVLKGQYILTSPLVHPSHRQEFNKRLRNSGVKVLLSRLLERLLTLMAVFKKSFTSPAAKTPKENQPTGRSRERLLARSASASVSPIW